MTLDVERRHAGRSGGRTCWSRFVLLLAPSLLTVAMLAGTAGAGLVPLVLTAEQRHTLKLSVHSCAPAG
jgi:predicted solute-binding protein